MEGAVSPANSVGSLPGVTAVATVPRQRRISSLKPADLEGELADILQQRSQGRTPSQIAAANERGRGSSVVDFNIFKKSIAYDSQYKEYEEEVIFKEPDFKVKRIVSAQGELMLNALSGISRKLEMMAMLPEVMGRLVTGDLELEQVLGQATVEAILRLFFVQTHWIEHRNVGEQPFRAIGVDLAEIKKRLQKGARYPPPQRKNKSFRLLIQESLTAGNEEEEDEEEDEAGSYRGQNQNDPAPTPSSLLSASVITSPSNSVMSLDIMGSGDGKLGIGPRTLGIPTEQYMREVLGERYREVFRLLTANQVIMNHLGEKVKPEVTQAVKAFYSQVQLLEGLMYVKFLMTPEEEIQRIQHLKAIWIKEQRLLREYRDLEEEFGELGNNREKVMHGLNASINALVSQIDSMSEHMRYEINKLSGEGNKQDLVNTKKFDQDLQQLDGNFQAALKFAIHLRAHFNEIENGWRKQRFKLEADLEALISNYDKEMSARQQAMDDCLMTEEANIKEIEHLEKVNKKVEARYAQFKDETMVKEIKKRKKSKKDKRGRSGKKKKGGSKKRKGSTSKGSKAKKPKGSKGSKKGKKKKGKKSPTDLSDSEYEQEEEEEESSKQKKSRKGKSKSKKGKRAKKGKAGVKRGVKAGSDLENEPELTGPDLPLGDDEEHQEEEENEAGGQGSILTKELSAEREAAGSPGKKKKSKKGKKGKRSKSKRKKKGKKKTPPPPEAEALVAEP